ncbi:hypothetical protein P7C70_g9121, partial [Phenoliferia sp. Uapishka_3]
MDVLYWEEKLVSPARSTYSTGNDSMKLGAGIDEEEGDSGYGEMEMEMGDGLFVTSMGDEDLTGEVKGLSLPEGAQGESYYLWLI